MPATNLTRLETTLLPEDADLLQRYAKLHGIPVSEIIRSAIYQYVPPLARAKDERDERAFREMQERQKLRAWTGRDPAN